MKKNTFKKKWKIIIIVLLIIVIAIIFFIGKGCKKGANIQEGQLTGEIGDGLLPGLTDEEIKAIMQKEADESLFSFDINTTPVFKDGDSEGNLRIANPPYNVYPIDVEIKLNSDNKSIFKSGRLKPNQYIDKASLTSTLDKGDYNATAVISAFDPKTEQLLGKTLAKLKISVKN